MLRSVSVFILAFLFLLTVTECHIPQATGQDQKPVRIKDKRQDKLEEPVGGVKDDLSRVLPVFDPGAHTQAISAMGFTKDNAKLVTVGQDYTVQVWSTATGERLDILRLPGYGREKGYDAGRWDVAAVSPDGSQVALGGEIKNLSVTGDNRLGRVVVVDLVKRSVVGVLLRHLPTSPVTAITFSPDGNTLVLGIEKGSQHQAILLVIGDLANRIKDANPLIRTLDCKHIPLSFDATDLAFAPDGKRFTVAGEKSDTIAVCELTADSTPVLTKEITAEGHTNDISWSADGKQFARTADGVHKSGLRGAELWNADGTREKVWKAETLNHIFTARAGKLHSVRILNSKTLYVVASGPASPGDGGCTIAGTIDIASGKDERIVLIKEGLNISAIGTASADGSRVAIAVTGKSEALIVNPANPRAPAVHCGSWSQLPYQVGWSKDPSKPGFAWATERYTIPANPDAKGLTFGFDLMKVEPIGAINGTDYLPSLRKLGEWTLTHARGNPAPAQLRQNGKLIRNYSIARGIGHTLVPGGSKPPLVAFATHMSDKGDMSFIHSTGDKRNTRLLPLTTRMHSMAASPDGRFVICTTGTPRIIVYPTDGTSYPLFSFAQINGEWVIWTPEGYYAASPGGEKVFGWAVNNGPNSLVTFYPADKFARHFRRPDVIRMVVEKGSVKEAILALNAIRQDVERILPPTARIELIEQRGASVKVKASAISAVIGKPVLGMRVLLDGRPLPDNNGQWNPEPAKPVEGVYEFAIPPGPHELKVLARSVDGAGISEPLIVRGPKVPGSQPTLYRLCIGINDYDEPGLKLNAASKDARALYDALGVNCVGSDNLFGAAKGELLLDKEATRQRALKALADVRKNAKPGDLVVVCFAGHGVKQGNSYYLLTREANVTEDLSGKSLSGEDLQKSLSDVECPVLMILDACHSANAVKVFRPATDDLTRSLTDDSVGVTVMSAAMSYEVAGGTTENGHFTAGLLKGLRAGAGVPFDPYERQLYVHHLYTVAFSEVRKATGGKQNPFLNMPWTSPPVPIREVPTGNSRDAFDKD